MKATKKFLSVLLAVLMVITILPTEVFAAEVPDGNSTVVIAGSDFQDPDDKKDTTAPESCKNVNKILTQIKGDHPTADGLIFCGDYDKDLPSGNVANSIGALKTTVTTAFPTVKDTFFVQGNHDQVTQGTNGLSGPGNHDTANYGVYIIDEDDYQWSSGANAAKIQQTAAKLDTYLDDKATAGYNKPIFVASHVPLHFSPRTQEGDAKYGQYIFDVLQEAGAKGLTIIFLYGHDHSQGWDNYMGGSSVYLPKGHDINIAKLTDTSGKSYSTYQLNFTYMNAGFVGYYADWEPETDSQNTDSHVDKAITMTVFEITDNQVTVQRYDETGVHDLKSEGKQNVKHTTRTQCPLMTDVLESPQYISLTTPSGSVDPVVPSVDDINYVGSYEYVDTVTAGSDYLLVSNGYALQNDNGVVSAVKVQENSDGTISVDETAAETSLLWTINENGSYTSSGNYTVENGGKYMGRVSGDAEQSVKLLDAASAYSAWSYVNNGTNLKQISAAFSTYVFYLYNRDGDFYVNYINHINDAGYDYTLKLYAKNETTPVPDDPEPDVGYRALEDSATGITAISSAGGQLNVNTLSSTKTYDGIAKYKLFDLSINGFTNGTDLAFVSIPIPSGYDASKVHVYHVNGDVLLDMNATVSNGKVTFATNHFSQFLVGEGELIDPDWVTVNIPGETTTIHKYVLDTNGLDNRSDYLIVANSNQYAIAYNGSSFGVVRCTINNNTIILDTNAYDYTVVSTGTSGQYYLQNGNNYLRFNNSGQLRQSDSTSRRTWAISHEGSGKYSITNTNNGYGLNVDSSGVAVNTNGNSSKRFFKYTPETTTQPGETYYLAMTGSKTYTFPTSQFASRSALETYLKDQITVYRSADKVTAEDVTYTLTANGSVNPTAAGTASYTVYYDGHKVGDLSVTFVAKTVTGISLVNNNSGSVYRGAKASADTNSQIRVNYSDGSHENVNITLGMVSGDFDSKTVGEYTGLTVTYGGATLNNYTLEVLPNPDENDYPEYPNEGAVKVNKTGSGIDFQSTGIAEVELSASGIPVNKGVDVIVMVDTSSSMKYGAQDGTTTGPEGKQRLDYLRNSLTAMLNSFTKVNEDGSAPDVRLALADFNGYTSNGASSGWPISSMNTIGDSTGNRENTAQVFTGSKDISTGAFVQVGNYTENDIRTLVNKVETKSGTNFDYAFDTIYRLAYAIKAENAANNEDRELYVIFMSDGCPYQYNYYRGGSSGTNGTNWCKFLNGEYTTSNLPANNSTAQKIFYKAETQNTHRMADAIKGAADQTFEVISPTNDLPGSTSISGKNYMYTVSGLDATMYSISFCVYADNNVTQSTIRNVISRTASSSDYYFEVQGTDQDDNVQARLDNAFTQISESIRQAATNAYFVDTMGDDYDLQMATYSYQTKDEHGNTVSKTITPQIQVKEYTVHSYAEYLAGSITKEQVGTSTNADPKILETVTFSADGTAAYSDQLIGSHTNILVNGVIRAENFYYNTTSAPVMIDTDADGTADYSLAPETFYWTIGTIDETEIALSYDVYLTGSMEGTRPAGSYPTNESAVLHYTNWLGNDAHKDTVPPVLPWKAATVSYAFYLVNADGEVIVNQASGQTGSFANKVAVTQPVTYATVLLNSGSELSASMLASDVLPAGYTLYDEDAMYDVQIASNEIDVGWTITKGTDSASTYVTNYHGNDFSNALTEDDPSYNYSNTVVWFAVVAEIRCVPDTVVVDYGLPVDINVLANDMFGNYATVTRVVNVSDVANMTEDGYSPKNASPVTSTPLDLKFGAIARLPGRNEITYTPINMQMFQPETFAYEVFYNNPNTSANNGYYYATVTVVPATLIYYEDHNDATNYVTFSGDWTDVTAAGSTPGQTNKQAQDRPGLYSFAELDANNVYGYDAVNAACDQYSLDGAKVVTVNSQSTNWPTATFTFTGTGFDLISVTSKDTGFVKVDVYKTGNIVRDNAGNLSVVPTEDRTLEYSMGVDNFYGYSSVSQDGYLKNTWVYNGSNNTWHVTREAVATAGTNDTFPVNPADGDSFITYDKNYTWNVTSDSDNALYQIPVIKCYNKLDYAQYEVVVTPMYSPYFQHTDGSSYDFYFDAVRVYNPADESAAATSVYQIDKEAYPQYIEIRENLINQDDFDITDPSEGAVFIDAFGVTGSISDYTEFGPNNEVYLMPGQSVAFQLTGNSSDIASIQLGAKCVDGSAAYRILSVDENGAVLAEDSNTLTTATDMFYSIYDSVTWGSSNTSNTIVLTNTGDNILSLTQVKLTFKTAPAPAAPVRMLMSTRSAMNTVSALKTTFVLKNTAPVVPDAFVDCGGDKSICPTAGYVDVPAYGNWAHPGIDFCVDRGIMGNTLAGAAEGAYVFNPTGTCTRATIVQILYSLTGKPAVSYTNAFSDVPANAWFTDAVMWAVQNGITAGNGTGFDPNGNVTREQMCVFLKAYAEKVAKLDTSKSADLSSYIDADKATWSKPFIRWAVAEGLLSGSKTDGKTYLDPQGLASRAQVATILKNFVTNIIEA